MANTKERDFYFDNLKFFLIFFVVLGHILNLFCVKNTLLTNMYFIIYCFHMPVFAFISGYFSKKIKTFNKKLIYNILIPYVVFQFLYMYEQYIYFHQKFILKNILTPYWIMWFMLSLFFWRITVILLKKIQLKRKYIIIISFVIGIISGFLNVHEFLAIERTFTFLPLFLLGYYTDKETIKNIKEIDKFNIMKLLLLLFVLVTMFMFVSNTNFNWFQGNSPYKNLGSMGLQAVYFKISVYTINILFGIVVMSIIPDRKIIISKLGSCSLCVYLLHGFVIKSLVYFNTVQYINMIKNGYLTLITISITAFIITIILSSELVTFLYNMCMHPVAFLKSMNNKIFKKVN